MIPLYRPIIEVSHLSHRFSDGGVGIDDISLKIAKGEFVVVAGHNGSGKTTLFRHLNGLLTPDTGEVQVDGIPVSADILRARQMVGLVFQDADSQIVGETVCEDVAFGPENLCLGPAEVSRRVASALSAVGLEHLADQKPHKLSGGEKRRLAIAGILAMEPQVLVLVGATALQAVLGLKGPISQLRGQWQSLGGRACMPIFHPAYLLRNGSIQPGRPRDLTRADLVAVREHLLASS